MGKPVAGFTLGPASWDRLAYRCSTMWAKKLRMLMARFQVRSRIIRNTYTAQLVLPTGGMSGSVHPPQEDLYRRIIRALVDARREANLRQVDVAKQVGWPQAYVSRYENHERTLSVSEYVEVAGAIGVDPVALLSSVLGEER